MIVSIHQPNYIPFLGYFYKMSQSDVFVFLDNAQFTNDGLTNWNRIKTPQGECRLKIPVEQHLGDNIDIVRTKDELNWKEKHLKTIEMNYKKSKFFSVIFPEFKKILLRDYPNISELNKSIIKWIANSFGFNTKMLNSSDMDINTFREERVIDIVKYVGGDTYISGNGAKSYQVPNHFAKRGVKLVYTNYTSFEYTQQWKKIGFLPNLSVIDYILNCGFDWDYVEHMMKSDYKFC